MKLRKIMSGVAAAAVASAVLAISSSAALVVPENAPAYTNFGTGNWMIKLYAPSEGIDLGLDVLNIGSVEAVIRPIDLDWFEGQTGGALFLSCGPASICPEDHNWITKSYWGVSDPDHELETRDDSQPVVFETIGDYLYKGSCVVDDSNCFYEECLNDEGGYIQLGVQEWGNDMSEIEVVSYTIYDKSGNVMVEFDGNGNIVAGGGTVEASAEEAAPAEEEPAEEAAPAEEAPAAAEEAPAPAAGDVQAVTTSAKGSPDTGIEDVAVIAGLALLAGGAVAVTKKRR